MQSRRVLLSLVAACRYCKVPAPSPAEPVYVVSIAERKIARIIKTAKGAGPDPVQEVLLEIR